LRFSGLDGSGKPPGRVLTTFEISDAQYGLNQLRYDLRKLKGHGPLERDGTRCAYRLSPMGSGRIAVP
jgi:hypothetical protein